MKTNEELLRKVRKAHPELSLLLMEFHRNLNLASRLENTNPEWAEDYLNNALRIADDIHETYFVNI